MLDELCAELKKLLAKPLPESQRNPIVGGGGGGGGNVVASAEELPQPEVKIGAKKWTTQSRLARDFTLCNTADYLVIQEECSYAFDPGTNRGLLCTTEQHTPCM